MDEQGGDDEERGAGAETSGEESGEGVATAVAFIGEDGEEHAEGDGSAHGKESRKGVGVGEVAVDAGGERVAAEDAVEGFKGDGGNEKGEEEEGEGGKSYLQEAAINFGKASPTLVRREPQLVLNRRASST